MSTFIETLHPRADNGTFVEKPQSAAEVELRGAGKVGECEFCTGPVHDHDDYRIDSDSDEVSHYSCYDSYVDAQAAYWQGQVGRPRAIDDSDAYEPGDPKRFTL